MYQLSLHSLHYGLEEGPWTLDGQVPKGLVRRIEEEVRKTEGVLRIGNLRVRRSGSQTFLDMRIYVPRTVSLERADKIATDVERKVQRIVPGADVVVHVDGLVEKDEKLADTIRTLASRLKEIKSVHSIEFRRVYKKLHVSLHVEVISHLSLEEAHRVADSLEITIKRKIKEVKSVTTHIESDKGSHLLEASTREVQHSFSADLMDLVSKISGVSECEILSVVVTGGKSTVSLRCGVDRTKSVEEAHAIASDVEKVIKSTMENVSDIIVHTDPV